MISFSQWIADVDPWLMLTVAVIFMTIDLAILSTDIILWIGVSLVIAAIQNYFNMQSPIQIVTIIAVSFGLSAFNFVLNPKKRKLIKEEDLNPLPKNEPVVGKTARVVKIIRASIEKTEVDGRKYDTAKFNNNDLSEPVTDKDIILVELPDGSVWEGISQQELRVADAVYVSAKVQGRLVVEKLTEMGPLYIKVK